MTNAPARPEARSDCSRCAALCCIAFPSDNMPGFAAEKEAGEPCPKLAPDGRCTIYASREEMGFGGCIRFECFGAGQHVVQTLFEGRDWRDDPALLGPMLEAFEPVRKACELLYLVDYARTSLSGDSSTRDLDEIERDLVELCSNPTSAQRQRNLPAIEARLRGIYARLAD